MNKLTVDELAEKIVREDVFCNVGQLVEFSIRMSYEGNYDAPITYEDLEQNGPDFYDMSKKALKNWLIYNAGYDVDDLKGKDKEDLIDICQHEYQPEIYEYWAVSSWLAEKLKERGEIVIDSYPDIWGRQTTGQAIKLDGVIRSIAQWLYEL